MRKTNRSRSRPTDLQLDVLLVLYRDDRLASDLLREVGELRGEDVPLATFYRQLQRAADAGWLTFVEDDPAARTPGRPERLYHLTATGIEQLREGFEGHRRRLLRARESGLLSERSS